MSNGSGSNSEQSTSPMMEASPDLQHWCFWNLIMSHHRGILFSTREFFRAVEPACSQRCCPLCFMMVFAVFQHNLRTMRATQVVSRNGKEQNPSAHSAHFCIFN